MLIRTVSAIVRAILPALLSLFLFTAAVPAQEMKLLTLDDAITIALEKSYEMKSLRLSLVEAEQNRTAARGRFKTNVDMELEVPNWNETVSRIQVPNQLPEFNTTGALRYEGLLRINQPLPTDGYLSLRSNIYQDAASTYIADQEITLKRKDMLTSLSLYFNQPLFTINQLKLGLQQANLSYERADRRFKRSELDLVYQVTETFYGLYEATRQLEIAQDNVKQQQELYDLARQKYEAGLIPEVEALEMEVDLAESNNNLVAAQARRARVEDTFKQLIGLDFVERVGVHTDIEIKEIDVDLVRAVELALNNRAEIRENEITVELAKVSVKQADSRSEISGELWAFYNLTGVSDPDLPFDSSPRSLWNSSLDDMQRRPNNRGVGFTISVPIWDWGVNRAEVEAARANLYDREYALAEMKKTIVRQVRDAVGSLHEAESSLEVLTKRQEVAERTFEITLERFNNGDITSTDLANNRDRLISARTAFLRAYIEYQLAIADLKRTTMWDFELDRPVIETIETAL